MNQRLVISLNRLSTTDENMTLPLDASVIHSRIDAAPNVAKLNTALRGTCLQVRTHEAEGFILAFDVEGNTIAFGRMGLIKTRLRECIR